jgi:prephenate dehydratase
MRAGYFGPAGTFTHEALLGALPSAVSGRELISYATIREVVLAVAAGEVESGLVPIENSLEGSVNATLDALVAAPEVHIAGELVRPIKQCLIARRERGLAEYEVVISHPHASAQCSIFLRTRMPHAEIRAAGSTAEAVRLLTEHELPWAALGNRLAAELYDCRVLVEGVEDQPDNETRFVWIARHPDAVPDARRGDCGSGSAERSRPALKTAIVFWGAGADSPGWLVGCLSAFADRDVNLTRIESRPRRQGFGHYMFFADLEGGAEDPTVAAALDALRARVDVLRVLGSFPVAAVPATAASSPT